MDMKPLSENQKPNEPSKNADRWGIVLAGGHGDRLRDFACQERADYLPKQYICLTGKKSMLEQTLDCVERLMPAERLLIVIGKEHLQFDEVRCQLASRKKEGVIIQPMNKDTGPGILLPLLYLGKLNPSAIVTIFPSDHFIVEENLFMEHVARACTIVESDDSRIVLLGAAPNEANPEYSYIVPAKNIDDPQFAGLTTVEMFIEKPLTETAKLIISKGGLWNTMVLVVACKTLLESFKHAAPELYRAFQPIQSAIGTPDEARVIEQVYQKLRPFNFSRGVLEMLSYGNRRNLQVLPVRGVMGSDWGTSERITKTPDKLGPCDFGAPAAPSLDTRAMRDIAMGDVPILRKS